MKSARGPIASPIIAFGGGGEDSSRYSATRRQYAAEEKVRIVIAGLRGEDSVAELCRKEGINQNLYYRWSKEFLEAGKKRLVDDTAREATSDEVKGLRAEAHQLKARSPPIMAIKVPSS
jgi:transposase-like protein